MHTVMQRRGTPARLNHRSRAEQFLLGLELFIGVTAVGGGLALIAQPDGSLLQAELSALAGTRFADWRVPGMFLLVLVGGGSLLTAFWLWCRWWNARALAVLSGLGVLAFELTEWTTIGFQPLEAVVGVLALLVVVLAWRLPGGVHD
jgi:hypothetical protein